MIPARICQSAIRDERSEKVRDQRVTETSPHAAQPHRVLIVDDEPALLDALKLALERGDCEVTACRTFEEARQKLLTEPHVGDEHVERLGAFNGIQLAVVARDRNAQMKIVVFSGFDDPVLRSETANLSATYLVKPITAEQLLEFIDDCSSTNAPSS